MADPATEKLFAIIGKLYVENVLAEEVIEDLKRKLDKDGETMKSTIANDD